MRFEGTLKSWSADRGFGFIEALQGGQEVFVHLSAIPTKLRPPKVGQRFTFEVELNRDGKKRAANLGLPVVRRATPQLRTEAPASWSTASILAIPLFVVIFVAAAARWPVSGWVALGYLALSIICIAYFAVDKSAARAGRRRVSEKSLLLLSLAGWLARRPHRTAVA